ncbi:MAG TPA: FlgD immunoglobulin-like domain containing protein, partial [Gaiellaceae bacterium]|nr:FlgD immunoglobulin-like domain containing protein [Gaiellaceae bacterium]
ESALASLLAWRLDVAHADPLARLSWRSLGNPRFPEGTVVSLRAVSWHRDTGSKSCPGDALYAQLGDIASQVAQLGLPKLYAPTVSGALGGPIRFTARLSELLAWTVTVTDSAGATIAQGTGFGTTVDWTWDSAGVAAGAYAYRIEAGASVRPATGTFGTPFVIKELRVRPTVLTPNGDSVRERTRISFALSAPGTATLSLVDAAGSPVGILAADRPGGPTTAAIKWSGAVDGTPVADGRYRVLLAAGAGTATVSRSARVVVDRTLGRLSVRPQRFAPRRARLAIGFTLAREARVRVRVVARGRTVATLFSGSAAAGRRTVSWNGRTSRGRAPRGDYRAVVEATTALGTRKLAAYFRLVG